MKDAEHKVEWHRKKIEKQMERRLEELRSIKNKSCKRK
jgi:hypothetical protein